MSDAERLYKSLDHTLLKPTATVQELIAATERAVAYQVASICIPPFFVAEAAKRVNKRIDVCTVIGFPLGYQHVDTKIGEIKKALDDGATEVDVVWNLSYAFSKDYDAIAKELQLLRKAADGATLKLILETGLFTIDALMGFSSLLRENGVDYLKTSTGFLGEGATEKAVSTLVHITQGTPMKVKASGGIQNKMEAEKYLALGASRIGASRLLDEA